MIKIRITICFIILLIVAAPTFAQDDEKYIFRETIGVSAGISSYKTFSRYDYNKPYLTKPSFVSVFPEFESIVTPENPILNYPNPFNYRTRITFLVEEQTQVTINIYKELGQKIATLINSEMPKGEHNIFWEGINDSGRSMPTGVYFYRIKTGEITRTGKMILLK